MQKTPPVWLEVTKALADIFLAASKIVVAVMSVIRL